VVIIKTYIFAPQELPLDKKLVAENLDTLKRWFDFGELFRNFSHQQQLLLRSISDGTFTPLDGLRVDEFLNLYSELVDGFSKLNLVNLNLTTEQELKISPKGYWSVRSCMHSVYSDGLLIFNKVENASAQDFCDFVRRQLHQSINPTATEAHKKRARNIHAALQMLFVYNASPRLWFEYGDFAEVPQTRSMLTTMLYEEFVTYERLLQTHGVLKINNNLTDDLAKLEALATELRGMSDDNFYLLTDELDDPFGNTVANSMGIYAQCNWYIRRVGAALPLRKAEAVPGQSVEAFANAVINGVEILGYGMTYRRKQAIERITKNLQMFLGKTMFHFREANLEQMKKEDFDFWSDSSLHIRDILEWTYMGIGDLRLHSLDIDPTGSNKPTAMIDLLDEAYLIAIPDMRAAIDAHLKKLIPIWQKHNCILNRDDTPVTFWWRHGKNQD
jgi:hypothetical protein